MYAPVDRLDTWFSYYSTTRTLVNAPNLIYLKWLTLSLIYTEGVVIIVDICESIEARTQSEL